MTYQIEQLEEQNKRLNIIIENTKTEQEADRKHIEELEEENEKLKEENDTLLTEKSILRTYCDELDSECDDLVVTKELLE